MTQERAREILTHQQQPVAATDLSKLDSRLCQVEYRKYEGGHVQLDARAIRGAHEIAPFSVRDGRAGSTLDIGPGWPLRVVGTPEEVVARRDQVLAEAQAAASERLAA